VVIHTFPAANRASIGSKTTSTDVEGWDSLSYSIFIMNIEQEFSIELPFERLYDLSDLGDLTELVSSVLAGRDAI
jgi:acyl carrier protein